MWTQRRYSVERLLQLLGRDAKLTNWLADITADCSRSLEPGYSDPCGARCPDLRKVF